MFKYCKNFSLTNGINFLGFKDDLVYPKQYLQYKIH